MDAHVKSDATGRKTVVDACDFPCAIERGMRILGGKWTGSIMWHLRDGPVRFNDLARMIAGASKKMVSERLRQLETQKLVKRTVVEKMPVAVTYELTALGQSALQCLDSLRIWSESLDDAETAA